MDTPKQPDGALAEAGAIVTDAERRLRELVSSAAAAGDYDAVQRITEWARTLGVLVGEGSPGGTHQPASPSTPTPGTGPGPRRNGRTGATRSLRGRRRSRRAVGTTATRRTRRAPVKGEYPKFFRHKDHLVKVGWSKKKRDKYVHKAPRRVVDVLAAAIARHCARGASGSPGGSGNSRLFTSDDVMPLKDPTTGEELPGYQAYVALAWFKKAGLVKQHGRSGYTVRNADHLSDAVIGAWQKLPEVTVHG